MGEPVTRLFSDGTMDLMMNLIGSQEIKEVMEVENVANTDEMIDLPELENNISEMFPNRHFPVSTGTLPNTKNYPGPYGFDINMRKWPADGAKWQYSKKLEKLFVNLNSKISIHFICNRSELDLYVRAMLVYTASDYLEMAVERCPKHLTMFKEDDLKEHVIQCNHLDSKYHVNDKSKRLSVLVPLDFEFGSNEKMLQFSFTCLNSCPLGMNFRNTVIVFTLEKANGDVVGRKVVNIKICSCPRRDMSREEEKTLKESEEKKKECDEIKNNSTSPMPNDFPDCISTPRLSYECDRKQSLEQSCSIATEDIAFSEEKNLLKNVELNILQLEISRSITTKQRKTLNKKLADVAEYTQKLLRSNNS